jgi:hypothetical protein
MKGQLSAERQSIYKIGDQCKMKKLILTILIAMLAGIVLSATLVINGKTVVVEDPWTPSEITTEAWYDASEITNITDAGSGYVSEWDDISGNGYTVTNHAGGSQPLSFQSNTKIYGKNAIRFDEAPPARFLENVEFTISTPYVAFIAFERYSSTNYFVLWDSTSGSNRGWLNPQQTGIYRSIQGGTILTPVYGAGRTVISVVANGTSPASSVNVNGNQTTGTHSGTKDGLRIGANYTGAGFTSDMSIGEVIFVAGTMTDAEREKVEGYLAWKWGAVSNLNPSHPYKTTRPVISRKAVNL